MLTNPFRAIVAKVTARTARLAVLALAVAIAPAAALLAPTAQGSAGDLLVGENSAGTILRVKPNGTHLDVASGAPMVSPIGMDFAHDGKLLVADYGIPSILKVDPFSHKAFSASEDSLSIAAPVDVEVGPDGKAYVLDQGGGGSIFRVSPSGKYVSVGDSSKLIAPQAFEIRHRDGMIFVADIIGLVAVNPRNGQERVVADGGYPWGIALTADGKIAYLTDGNDFINKVVIRTGARSPVATGGYLSTGVNMHEMIIEPSGKLVVIVKGFLGLADVLIRVNPANGKQSKVAGDPVTDPYGLQIEPPRCGGRLATITGSQKADVLSGSKYPDVIAGLGGRDLIRGLRGSDIICGGEGADKMIGGRGGDRLLGGPGRDTGRG